MENQKMKIGVLFFLTLASLAFGIPECSSVTSLFFSCSTFITYGTPDPYPGSPCCYAMTSLDFISESSSNRRFVCRCLMGLITTYNPNATAISSLPGFCGVSLGFTIDPNTDCNL
ncbi:hypothetical protein UlMin_024396 [Ulmus minor]